MLGRDHLSSIFLLSIFVGVLQGCTVKVESLKGSNSEAPDVQPILSSAFIENDCLVLRGTSLGSVTKVQIQGVDEAFHIDSQSENELRASVSSALKLLSNKSYTIIASTANAEATAPITLVLDDLGAQDGQILQFDSNSNEWKPGDLNGLRFVGSWNAQTNTPELLDGGAATQPLPGDYYIVSSAGTTALDGISSWLSGDWVVYRSDGTWTKIVNNGGVTSFNGRMGAVVPEAGDYSFMVSDLSDVDLTSLSDGKVLKWNSGSSRWVAATDETGSGAVTGNSISVSGGGYVNGSFGVGMGSTPSSATLQVSATQPSLLMEPTTSGNSSLIQLKNDSATTYGVYLGVETSGGGTLVTGSSASSAVIGQRGNAQTHIISSDKIGLTVDTSGWIGLGTTTPSAPLQIYDERSTNGDVKSALTITRTTSSGNGSDGIGAQVMFQAENSAGAIKNVAAVNGVLTSATSTSESGALSFEVQNGGTFSEVMRITNEGRVGIGTTTPQAALDVNGTIKGKAAVSNGTSTIDFSTGNIQYTSSNCGSFTLHNLKDGGTYIFIVKGATSNTCSFTGYSGAGSGALTIHMPSDHGATTTSKHTLYNLLIAGNDVYINWVPGL